LSFWLVITATMQAQQYVFRAYRQAEGLKNLAINDLAKDREGFLWVATENGVYRFLGSGFERFGPEQGIADLNIRALIVDPNGTVWAATYEDLYRWNGQRFVAAGSRPIAINAWYDMVVEDAHHLLIVENGHLYRLQHDDLGRMTSYLPVFSSRQIAANAALEQVSSVSRVNDPVKGTEIWVGCQKKLYSWVERDAGGNASVAGALVEWGNREGLGDDEWEGVFLDHAGTIWAGGRFRIAVLALQAKRFADRSIPGSTVGSTYAHAPFIEDREGRVLAPSEDGVARWDGTGWRNIGRANGLELTDHVVSMAFDTAGDLWLASRGDGLYNWVGYEDWEGWSDAARLPSPVIWSIVSVRPNRIVLGTDKGPGWIDPTTGLSGPLSSSRPWTFGQLDTLGLNKDGTLWGGTFSASVVRIDPVTGDTKQTAKLPAFITRSVADSSGHVFFTTNHGIYVRDIAQSTAAPRRVTAADPLLTGSSIVFTGCQTPDGTLWFLTKDRLIRLQNNQWTKPPIDGMPQPSGFLLDLSCASDGSVWITGQQTGTWRLRPHRDRIEAWQLPLPIEAQTLTPVAILADRRGWVWLGTDSGLLVWNGQAWRQLTQESGLIWNDLNQGTLMAAVDGSIWIGTSGGVAHLLHPERVFDSVPLNAVVSQVRRGDSAYSLAEGIKLPWSKLPLSFQLSSPAMRNRSQLVFDFRMDGLHTDWIENQDGAAVFSNLPPGTYTFTAMARNLGLNSTSPTIKVMVKILPPWWKTPWFTFLCCVGFLFLFAAGDQIRARQLIERSRQLEIQVKKRTEELEERIREAKVAEEKIRKLAFYDPLTHLPNRRLLSERLKQTLAASAQSNRRGALLFIDIDNFKDLNDTLGHKTGDLLLQEVASCLTASVRSGDTVARLGGDEFVVILEELSQSPDEAAAQAKAVAEKILARICRSYQLNGRECLSTSSIGITVIGEQGDSIDDVLPRADIAMYQGKQAGGNSVHFFVPALQHELNARAAMERELRRALISDQFLLYFQPQLDAGELVGAEALIRWRHPVRGLLSPGKFIPLAEETGLILPLGDWVLETACAQIAAWGKRESTAGLTLAVNISARQLRKPDFVEQVLAILKKAGANPLNLKLELTESMLVENIEQVISTMTEIKSHGIGFALDDFGTGYSSLSYLKRLPLDQLKIDRSFVRDIVEDVSSRAIAQSVISLGQVMNMSVIAEGVETEEQLEHLTELGCHAFQGYLFGQPMPVDDFELMLPVFRNLHSPSSAQANAGIADRHSRQRSTV
jgi:diguanylate cyclase (GGDEF)-like protein